MSKIHFLPVKHGDAFILECEQGGAHGLIVVDGGPTGCGYVLKSKLVNMGIPDVMVLTHYDDDHIGGLLQLVNSCLDDHTLPAKEVWANCAGCVDVAIDKTTSAKQGVKLSVVLNELRVKHGMEWSNDISEGYEKVFPFASIEVISPTKDVLGMAIKKQQEVGEQFLKATPKSTDDLDTSLNELALHSPMAPNFEKEEELANAASIAFILRCEGLSILMLGDCYPQNVERYLKEVKGYSEENPLEVDFVKVSHHGSRNNTSNELLDIIKCNKFIISTNGGKNKTNHPDRTTIAHILCHQKRNREEPIHLYFNYSLDIIEANGAPFFKEDEKIKWNFEVHDNTNEL